MVVVVLVLVSVSVLALALARHSRDDAKPDLVLTEAAAIAPFAGRSAVEPGTRITMQHDGA